MTQLSYNEAFDPYHAAFRFLRLSCACNFKKPLAFDTFRILDFYLLFPFRLQNMKFVNEDIGWRKISRSYISQTPYGEQPDDQSLFTRMEPFQRAAASSLAKCGILDSDDCAINRVFFSDFDLPKELNDRCEYMNQRMMDIVEILCQLQARYPLLGAGGLKDRTGLLEYRYDAI